MISVYFTRFFSPRSNKTDEISFAKNRSDKLIKLVGFLTFCPIYFKIFSDLNFVSVFDQFYQFSLKSTKPVQVFNTVSIFEP
jgi:hypothetical protein